MNSGILIGFLATLTVATCQDDGQVYCGRRLSTALAMLCENGLIKKSETYGSVLEHAFPWIPVQHASTMGRNKRQVVSECCFKPCTIDELISYCA